jgi:hypothetical protein
MAEEERQATPYMGCFDLDGTEEEDKTNLLAGIRGNENAGKDKGFKKVVATHGAPILGTLYSLSFETVLRAIAFLEVAKQKLGPDEYLQFLTNLSQGDDVKSLAKMVLEKRTDYSGKSLVNPAVAGDVAVTGEALPGRWASLTDPLAKAKRQEITAGKKADKKWLAQEKGLRAAGLFSEEEIAAKKKEYMAKNAPNGKELADQKFDGNLEDTGPEETEPQGVDKVKAAAVDGAAGAVNKGFGKLFGA